MTKQKKNAQIWFKRCREQCVLNSHCPLSTYSFRICDVNSSRTLSIHFHWLKIRSIWLTSPKFELFFYFVLYMLFSIACKHTIVEFCIPLLSWESTEQCSFDNIYKKKNYVYDICLQLFEKYRFLFAINRII